MAGQARPYNETWDGFSVFMGHPPEATQVVCVTSFHRRRPHLCRHALSPTRPCPAPPRQTHSSLYPTFRHGVCEHLHRRCWHHRGPVVRYVAVALVTPFEPRPLSAFVGHSWRACVITRAFLGVCIAVESMWLTLVCVHDTAQSAVSGVSPEAVAPAHVPVHQFPTPPPTCSFF